MVSKAELRSPIFYAGLLGASLFAVLLLRNFYLLHKYAVNLPAGDSWEALSEPAFGLDFWDWIFARHNEHIIVPTKLLTSAMFWLNGWNVRTEQLISFGVFSLIPLGFCLVARRILPSVPWGVWLAFLSALMTTVLLDDHFSPFLSQLHFAHVFKFAALLCLFHPSRKWAWIIAGLFFSGLTVVSFSTGMASIAVILALFLAWRAMEWKQSEMGVKAQAGLVAALVALLVVGAVGTTFGQTLRKLASAQLTLPHSGRFWHVFLKFVGRGLSFPDAASGVSITALALMILLPLVILARRRDFFRGVQGWLLVAGVAATLAELALLTIGRAKITASWDYVAGRYCEISFLLMPWAAVLWAKVAEEKRWLVGVVLGLWGIFAFNLRTENQFQRYLEVSIYFRTPVPCLLAYYNRTGAGVCPLSYPRPLWDKLDRAKALNLSFYEDLVAGRTRSPVPVLPEKN